MLRLSSRIPRLLHRSTLKNSLARNFATKNLLLPKIADSIEDVTMMTFLVQEGDYVFEDQEIIEVESHKGTQNIRSTMSGLVTKFLVEEEQIIYIGDSIAELDVDAPAPEKKVEAPKKAEAPVEAAQKQDAPAQPKQAPKEANKQQAVPAQPIVQGKFNSVSYIWRKSQKNYKIL